MKRIAMLFVGVVSASMVAAGPAAAAKQQIKCNPKRHSVMVRVPGEVKYRVNGLVAVKESRQVWIAADASPDGDATETTGWFACWKSSGRGTYLLGAGGGAAVTNTYATYFALNGRYAAFRVDAFGDENYQEFKSIDVKTGRTVRSSARFARSQAVTDYVRPLVVTSSGAIAFLTDAGLTGVDGSGARLLAAPTAGPIELFAPYGESFDWRQNGKRSTATLK